MGATPKDTNRSVQSTLVTQHIANEHRTQGEHSQLCNVLLSSTHNTLQYIYINN